MVFNDVGVHDPSVVRADDDTFYVVGSHLAMAKSPDLVSWELVATDVNDANPLFNTYASEIAEGIDYVGGWQGSWASDIIKLADGRWYFYYDHCATADDGECDWPRSYLGVAVSEDIEGPYSDLGIFLWSGQTDQEIANGYGVGSIVSFDPVVHPNVIDPTAFHDKDGGLWLVYGSYSGGIFVLEMDQSTGKPKPGQGYGTHVAGGSHSAIEGPFVLYSPETDYYYLFTSFGGYVADDGYNMRVSRSRNPNGPFVDAEGNDMIQARGNWESISPYGVKIMGGFEFTADIGNKSPGWGYKAPGHNSAYYDADTGKHILIHHARFPGRGEAHAIRVHELFVTESDWPVASPQRYVPLSGDNVVGANEVTGLYQFINHGKDINRTPKQSTYVRLEADGAITGDSTGQYALSTTGGTEISLTIDGLDYEGVVQWQWDDPGQRLTPVVSALASTGETIWLSQVPDLDTSTVLASIVDTFDIPQKLTGDSIELPTLGTRGATISWSTSNNDIIKTDGTVIRPNYGDGDATVTLTATVSLEGEEQTAMFDVTVRARSQYNRVAQFDFENGLDDTLGNFSDARGTGDRLWKISGNVVSYPAGHDGLALNLDGSNGVRLPDGLISNYEYSVSFWINPTALSQFATAFFGAIDQQQTDGDPFSNHWISLLPQGWDGNTMFWSGSDPWFDGITGQLIPASAWSHVGFSVNQGLVKVFINGIETFSAGNLGDLFSDSQGIFSLGVNYWDTPFNGMIDDLRIYDAALAAEEIKALDIDRLPADQLLQIAVDRLDPGDLSAVKEDLHLPVTGAFATAIDWMSSDPYVIAVKADTGVVTRPEAGLPNVEVTLTAIVTLEGMPAMREFTVTVLSQGAVPEPVAIYAFEDNLDDSTGNFGTGVSTGDRITSPGGSIGFGDGVAGRALVLDGATGVALGENLVKDATYSISVWLNPAVLQFYSPALFGGLDCTLDGAACSSWISLVPGGLDPGGETMLWSGTAWYDAPTGLRIPAGNWTHFVAVNDNGNVRVYLDGVEKFSGTDFPDVFSGVASSGFWIGINHWDPPYQGSIDELKFYNQALTATEVATIHAVESGQ